MPPRGDTLADEIRALYRGPLGEFIAGRKALAKRLKQTGDPRHAEIGELIKPAVSAWAVNRLFAEEEAAMAALLGGGERVRAAQRKESPSAAGALREALATLRAETTRLAARGAELLAAGERAPGESILERLRTNLDALALDPAHAAIGERGWLDVDLPPPGFELLAALQVAAAGARPATGGPAAPPASPPAERQATVHQLDDSARRTTAARKQREQQEREQRERGARRDELRAALSRAEADAAAQERAVDRARQQAERAAREAADATRRNAEAQAAATEASARAKAAAGAVERARRALSELDG